MSDKKRYDLILEMVVELLDIPPSYYQKAADRYRSLGEWLQRKESKVSSFSPEIYPQGSFRYGTVIRPLLPTEEYDLDLVCQVDLQKIGITQQHVKNLIGDEIKAYGEAHSFKEAVKEKPRCWRLNYADDVTFHMDILPCIPEDADAINLLVKIGVPIEFARTAVAITDKRRPNYGIITRNWPTSNPRGIAAWFENRARPVAYIQIEELAKSRIYASVDKVPSYEWKTPLQRSIQILKRHRDVMFKNSPEWKPLSMIITTLATHAYGGETDFGIALENIVEGITKHVRSARPRVPNPVNPGEDFADRWAKDARFEQNFWTWHAQIKVDLNNLRILDKVPEISRAVQKRFDLNLTGAMVSRLEATGVSAPRIIAAASTVHIASGPKPWRRDD
ncbi:MAG: nucleotidyltransferase [Sedimentisphaerales bacterium]|nr:nucleotidyltransferase [Sedimentisphaerales bacterium]